MRDMQRDLLSYTLNDLAELTRLELARLSLRAEEEAAALWMEHADADGRVPADVEARAQRLSVVSDFLERLARPE